MASYTQKAEESREAAEICLQNDHYNSAASRYYYSLFLRARGVLEQSNFDYKGFLKNSEHLEDKQRSHNPYSHATIPIALAEFLNYDVKDFKEDWDTVYVYRIKADYRNEEVTKENIDKSRTAFYDIYRRIM